MKKNILNLAAGALLAVTCLFGAAGCKNQLDYVNDTTRIAKMQVLGFKVAGLDSVYDKKTATLYMVNDGKTTAVASGTVCDVTATASYQSGTAYVKLDTPYIYDGDALNTSVFECYLDVNGTKVQVASSDNTENEDAQLSVVTSPAATADSDLEARFVNITVLDGSATFAWAKTVTVPSFYSYYQIKMDMNDMTVAEVNATNGLAITAAAKAGTYAKYTVTIKGLTRNVGSKFVVAGASICSSASGTPADNWNIMETAGTKLKAVVTDSGLVQTVGDDGTAVFTFYGTAPSWAAAKKSPAVKIAAYNVDEDPWICLLSSSTGDNFFFPSECDGEDVSLTIDVSKLASSYWSLQSAGTEAVVYIDAIKLIKAPVIGAEGYLAFCEGWLPNNAWNSTTPNKVTTLDSNGIAWFQPADAIEYKPAASTMALPIQILDPDEVTNAGKDNEAGFWDNKVGNDTITTPTYKVSSMKNNHYVLVVDRTESDISSAATSYLIPTSYVTDLPWQVKGAWYHLTVDTSTAPAADTVTFICNNNNNGKQTDNISIGTGGAVTGAYYYEWDYTSGKAKWRTSTRSDNPACTPTTGNVDIYVYTNYTAPYIWCWAGSVNFTSGNWPGLAMTAVN